MPTTMEISNHVYDTNSETFLNKVGYVITLLMLDHLWTRIYQTCTTQIEKYILNAPVKVLPFTKLLKMKSMSVLIISITSLHQI